MSGLGKAIYNILLFVVPITLLTALAIRLWRSESYRHFPAFYSYTVFAAIGGAIRAASYLVGRPFYFYVYWGTEAIYAFLGLVVICEALKRALGGLCSTTWTRRILATTVFATLLIALCRLTTFPPAHIKVTTLIVETEFAVRLVQVVALCALLVLVRFFDLAWSDHSFGVVLGYGLFALVALAAIVLRSEFGPRMDAVFSISTPLTYIFAISIWLLFFMYSRLEPAVIDAGPPPLEEHNLDEYMGAIKESLRR